MNEKTLGKNGQRGFEYGGVLTRAGEFLPFFFSLFSLSSLYFFMEEEVNDDVVWKEQTFGESLDIFSLLLHHPSFINTKVLPPFRVCWGKFLKKKSINRDDASRRDEHEANYR